MGTDQAASERAVEGAQYESPKLAPPGGLLKAQEVSFLAAGEVKLEDIVLVEDAAFGPTGVFPEVGRSIEIIDRSDVIECALNHRLRLEGKRGACRRVRGHLVCDPGKHQDRHKGGYTDRDLLHLRSSPPRRGGGPRHYNNRRRVGSPVQSELLAQAASLSWNERRPVAGAAQSIPLSLQRRMG